MTSAGRNWTLHHAASASVGLPVRQLEHGKRDAVVSVSPLGDGTATISLSIRVRASELDAMAAAELMLDELGPRAIESGQHD